MNYSEQLALYKMWEDNYEGELGNNNYASTIKEGG